MDRLEWIWTEEAIIIIECLMGDRSIYCYFIN